MISEVFAASSLEKIFPESIKNVNKIERASILKGEVYSFQIVCFCDNGADISVTCDSDLDVSFREVTLNPCEFPANDYSENPYILKNTCGLYPDALTIHEKFRIPPRQYRCIWVTVKTSDDTKAKLYRIEAKLSFKSTGNGEIIDKTCGIDLDILPADLPEQQLIHTEWFHADCIYTRYGVECWSNEHWDLLEKYFLNFSAHGMNMLLTPLWTPPLDTAVGAERPTVQLLDISCENGVYSFDFSRLEKWICLAQKCGIKYFEMAHPFTQWGAEHAPKIIVNINGKDEKLFGWHTDSCGTEYTDFLRQLFPQLLEFLEKCKVKENCFFHVSDEPSTNHIPTYSKCAALIKELTCNGNIIDALSSIDFYNLGLVKTPIPGNNHIEDFRSANVKPLWTYYCCAQTAKVPNRFFNFPSLRSRIMGVLMYIYDIAGFLQWGYNFWYSRRSEKLDIDPFRVTDADRAFPSGDAFMVYPGADGPVDSIRHEVMREALQDLRALKKLETFVGRDKTLEFIHADLDYQLSMTDYPRSAKWLLDLRERVNSAIKNAVCK